MTMSSFYAYQPAFTGGVHGLRRGLLVLASLPFAAAAQDDSAVIEWRHDPRADVAGFRIYYGRDPRSPSRST